MRGQFTIFGRVTEGLETARKISGASVGTGPLSPHPIIKQALESVEFR